MHQRLNSTLVERFRSSLGRQDAQTTLNRLTERVIDETLPTGNLTNEAELQTYLRRVITRIPGSDGGGQYEIFGIPIRMVAEVAAVALEDAIAYTVRLQQGGDAASTRDAQKHLHAFYQAGLVLSVLLAIDRGCVPPRRVLGSLMNKVYDEDSAAMFMTAEPDFLINQFVQTCLRPLKVSLEYFEAARRQLFIAAFSYAWQQSGPLEAVQSLYYLFYPTPQVFQALIEQIEHAPGRLNQFVQQGFVELNAVANHALNSGDATLAGSLWNGARGLCTFADNGQITIARFNEDLRFAADVEAHLNAAGATGNGKDLTTWMLLGHTICRAHSALASDDYAEIAGALGCFERISKYFENPSGLGGPPRTRIAGVLRRFEYQDAEPLIAKLEKCCRQHLEKRLSEAVDRLAAAPIADIAQENMLGLRRTLDDLVSHRLFWRYAPEDRSISGLDHASSERRTAWRKVYNGLPDNAVQGLRERLTALLNARLPAARPEFPKEMLEALTEHASMRASRSRETERSFP